MRKLLLIALLGPGVAMAQGVRVTGATFDSLSGRPMAAAFITLGSRSTIADSAGRFAFDSVAPGSYRLTMQHDLLDSLGLSGVAMTVNVTGGMQPIHVATPSIMTMWRRVCPGEAPPDSGFMFGTVLDATTRRPVQRAPIIASWIDLRGEGRAVNAKEIRLESVTNDDGSFVLCGVPLGMGVRLRSTRDSTIAMSFDVVLSRAAPVRRQDLSLGDAGARGVVRGTVASANKPVENAHVLVAGTEGVTNSRGQFFIQNVPAGTQQVEVQGIGFAPQSRVVNIGANDTVSLAFDIERIVTLDSVTVRGSAIRQRLARQFEQRKKLGIGYYRDSLQLAQKNTLEGVFISMPSVMFQNPRGRPVLSIGSRCASAVIYIDRMRTDVDHLVLLRPSDLGGLEVYRVGEIPPDLATLLWGDPMRKPCAVVAWTKMGWK